MPNQTTSKHLPECHHHCCYCGPAELKVKRARQAATLNAEVERRQAAARREAFPDCSCSRGGLAALCECRETWTDADAVDV